MKFSLLFLLVLVAGCGKSAEKQDCDMVCEAADFTLPVAADGSLPREALDFDTNLKLLNFTDDQAEKVRSAAEMIQRIVASEEFRSAVLNHTWEGKKQFADNNGLTNRQVYDRLLIGAEQLNNVKNNTLDVELQLYYEASSTVGYTYPSTPRIWMNTKYFNAYEVNQVAANLMHEWLHKLGFGHEVAATARRSYSVPYAVGSIIRRLGESLSVP